MLFNLYDIVVGCSISNFISLDTNQFKQEYRDSWPAEYETDVLKKTSITNANILRGTTMPGDPISKILTD